MTDLIGPQHLMGRCGRHSKQANRPCRNWAMRGQTVCRIHGGKSPQAMKKAEERLRDLEHPAISTVAELIIQGDTDAIRFAASRWVLEVLGHKPSIQAEVDQQVTIRVVREDQPIAIEIPSRVLSNGHTHD